MLPEFTFRRLNFDTKQTPVSPASLETSEAASNKGLELAKTMRPFLSKLAELI